MKRLPSGRYARDVLDVDRDGRALAESAADGLGSIVKGVQDSVQKTVNAVAGGGQPSGGGADPGQGAADDNGAE